MMAPGKYVENGRRPHPCQVKRQRSERSAERHPVSGKSADGRAELDCRCFETIDKCMPFRNLLFSRLWKCADPAGRTELTVRVLHCIIVLDLCVEASERVQKTEYEERLAG